MGFSPGVTKSGVINRVMMAVFAQQKRVILSTAKLAMCFL